ncbi:MAG: diacylglycerol kinase [Campylobacterales bacterium]|nr:diacylglycerol kinase [Campylobacterales bacterium]
MSKEEFDLNQVKSEFSLFRNFRNSVNGFIEVTKNEKPMQTEVGLFIIGTIIIFFLDIGMGHKAILFISLMFPIFAELINSSIERVVDLVTLEYHELAKHAKDAGSAVVLVSLIMTGLIWVVTLYDGFIGF